MLESRDEFIQGLEKFFSASVEYDANGNIVYTAKDINIVQPKDRKGTAYPWLRHYGFVRALCDKQGNVLAYTRASRVHPDPFPSTFHQSDWYAFDEYHPELLGDFQLHTQGYVLDDKGAYWSYDAATRTYTLTIRVPTVGPIEHWFIVSDDHITTDYGSYYKHYLYDVRNDKPNPEIVENIRSGLISNGTIPSPVQTVQKKSANWIQNVFARITLKRVH